MYEEHYHTVTCDMDDEDEMRTVSEYCAHAYTALPEFDIPDPPPFAIPRPGIREASMRHDELARRKYVKPFKWFKFNRARKATAK